MTTIQVIILLTIIVASVVVAAFLYKSARNIQHEPLTYTDDELENIKLAQQLFNKDLRPVVAKKAKVRVAKELNVVEPQFVTKEGTSESAVDKPLKKKRKFYPRKKKQQQA